MTAKPFCDGPFSVLKGTNWIVGKDHHGDICHVLDQRGWGYLTGKGRAALGLDSTTASLMQADMQQWVVDALNDAWNRRAAIAAVPAQVRVKPLDVSYVQKHAFLAGVVAARNIPATHPCSGPLLWLDYDPGDNPALTRILDAIDHAAIREAALREAAEVRFIYFDENGEKFTRGLLFHQKNAILALIGEKK